MVASIALDDFTDAAILAEALQRLLPVSQDKPRKAAAIRRLLQRSRDALARSATLH